MFSNLTKYLLCKGKLKMENIMEFLKKFEIFLLFLTFLIPDIFYSLDVLWNVWCSSFHKNIRNGRECDNSMLRPHGLSQTKKAYKEKIQSKFKWVNTCFWGLSWRKGINDMFKSKLYLNQILACNNCIIRHSTVENHLHFFLENSFNLFFFYLSILF